MYSKITIIGNLGRDPEMRYTAEGKAFTSFSVATTNWKKETSWYRVTVWGKMAEACNQHLSKGSKVLVEGELQADTATGGPRLWTRKDGSPAASFEIDAHTVKFLSGRNEDTAAPAQGSVVEEDDIPF